MRNGRLSTAIHRNLLVPSNIHVRGLILDLEPRFKEVIDMHERTFGYLIFPPMELQNDMVLWRTLAMRHANGDYRNTEDEKRATRTIAQWTVDVKCMICDQPKKIVEWED